MLSFLVLVSTSGQPLSADAVARCTRPPVGSLTFRPVASTSWRSDAGHVLLAAWGDRSGEWHVGRHGCTLATSPPWPLASRFTAPSGVAFELTDRLGSGEDPGALGWLSGATAVVRAHPDGTGLVGAPPTGGGTVHVAEGDGVLAVADRAAVAALGAGGGTRRRDLAGLLRGTLLGEEAPVTGVRRLRPGGHVVLRGRDGARLVDGPTPWADAVGADVPVAELAAAAADDVARLLELARQVPGRRVVELGDDPGSLVVAAGLAATGIAERFTLRPRDDRSVTAVEAMARVLDTPVAPVRRHEAGGEALDDRVRAAVGRTAAAVAVTTARSGPLGGIADDLDLLVLATPGGPLRPDPGPTGRRLLSSQAASALDAADARWADGRGRTAGRAATRAVLAELDRRGPLRQRAVADLVVGGSVLDPLATPSVARLALAAATTGDDATGALVEALHPPLTRLRPTGALDAAVAPVAWRELAPVLEAQVLGHGRDELADVLDIDEVATVVRSGASPDDDTARTLEGALTLAVWAARTDVHRPSPGRVLPRPAVSVPDQVPTLVTGVTSRSLLDLADLAVPLDEVETDAMLGVRVDREVRDLVLRVLLSVDAAPGHLPAGLDERLSGPSTLHLAAPARALLARRGGTLADPRLALTLPFWRAHVGPPRVVLVAERPPDLVRRSPAALPTLDLLGWWVDAMTAAAASRSDVRIVDPGDLLDEPEAEAMGWDGLGDGDAEVLDLHRVVRTVDSLVREVELDAARPLLRTIRAARVEDLDDGDASRHPLPAAAPLHVVDELWERAVVADERLAAQRATAEELEVRLAALEAELDDVRGRRGLKAAWATLRGRT